MERMSESTADFAGLRVAALESRRADDMARLIARHGGEAFVSPSMREVPLGENSAAIDFAHRLITGEIDCVIFLTGVGFRHLLAAVERGVDRQRYLDALTDIVTIARGPKPVAAMKEVGLSATHRVPEPNTWRDILTTIDRQLRIANQCIAVQEYGISNPSLVAGLEARGARVVTVPVYKWDLPEDTSSLESNVRAIVSGNRDVILFTSAHQVTNLLRMAERIGLCDDVVRRMRSMAVCSIGPTTSEMLREHDLPVDVEPEHPRMGQLVAAAAGTSGDVLKRKRPSSGTGSAQPKAASTESAPRVSTASVRVAEGAQPPAAADQPAWYEGPFMKACRREPTDVTPVWLMRQAGRYMAEYRQVRSSTGFLELCKNPALCSEVMCTAVARLGVDAAIIFSDLLPILEPMGLALEYARDEGPVIHNPVREGGDVDRVRELESMDELRFVEETVRQTRRDLPPHIPLIGFAGAPFTLASYTIEGCGSRSHLHTKSLMYGDEGAWRELMQRLARAVALYLNAQIAAGAQCVQLFDSWVGCLGPDDYRRYVLPHVRHIIDALPADVPVIHFATGNPALLPLLAEAGGSVIGVDWRVRLDDAWKTVGYDRAVQGNLDPAVLLSSPDTIRARAQEILDQAAGRPGHIFNLGHGILAQTPVENAIGLVEAVHALSGR